jgi:hypothetical protein
MIPADSPSGTIHTNPTMENPFAVIAFFSKAATGFCL